MRVLHLTSSFPRDARDHVAPFLLDLTHAEQDAGIDVKVLAPHDASLPRVGEVAGVEVHRFRYGPDRLERLAYRGGLLGRSRSVGGLLLLPVFLLRFTFAAARLTRRLRPDVLHAHWWLPAGMCALFAARVTNTPLMITVHGSDAHLLQRRWVRRLARTVLRRADVVATVSQDLKRQLECIVPGLTCVVLRLPVTGDNEPSPLPDSPPLRLLAAGRLSPEKGFDVLIDAMHLAAAAGLDVHLNLVGSGPERERLAALAAPLGHRVTMTPAVPRADLLELMDDVHALIAPSRREGLGMVALEAFTRGRPVVASRVGGLAETVDHGVDGLLVPPGDARALAEVLHLLPLAPPGGAALDRHDPDEVGRAHLKAYEEMCAAVRQ